MSLIVCAYCDLTAKWRCDHDDGNCSLPLCNGHRLVVGRNKDHCWSVHSTEVPDAAKLPKANVEAPNADA